jgi:hypothetical protein
MWPFQKEGTPKPLANIPKQEDDRLKRMVIILFLLDIKQKLWELLPLPLDKAPKRGVIIQAHLA